MIDLHITVANKVATYSARDGNIVCGNSDYQIVFGFDDEWDDYSIKTARFIWNNQYMDVVFAGTTVAVPVISNATLLWVGVYAGNIHTTTPAIIGCKKSITDSDPTHVDPTPDVYDQIITLINSRFTGVGISTMTINAERHMIVTLSDDTEIDAGLVPIAQPSVEQETLIFS